jgi:hypothetical protein
MLVRLSKDKRFVELYVGGPSGWDYEFAKEEIMTRRGLIRWIHQLSEKNWVTTEHLHELVELSNSLVNA